MSLTELLSAIHALPRVDKLRLMQVLVTDIARTADFASGEWVPKAIDGQELPDWRQGPTMYRFVKQLGAEGWELITVSHTGQRDIFDRFIFKRPAAVR